MQDFADLLNAGIQSGKKYLAYIPTNTSQVFGGKWARIKQFYNGCTRAPPTHALATMMIPTEALL
jgi:hypothetical protein